MSEYQYYRFESLVQRLDNTQRQALRTVSSRAEISDTSFQVHYHYSDLKAEPYELMLSYFDIGFYYANWGSIDVYIRLPQDSIPDALLNFESYGFTAHANNEYQLLIFSIEERHEYFDDEQVEEFFDHLTVLRRELIQGNWRLLYFMWLREFEYNDGVDAIPLLDFDFSYQQFSEHHLAFVALFEIPLALCQALKLVLDVHPSHPPKQSRFCVDAWLEALSVDEKDQLLKMVIEQGSVTRDQLLAKTKKARDKSADVYQYWLNAEVITPYIETATEQYQQAIAEALAMECAIAKEAHEQQLLQLYGLRDKCWMQIQEQANRNSGSGYDQASKDLHQLCEAYQFTGNTQNFDHRLKSFIAHNASRKALLKRLQDLLKNVQKLCP
ncbi:hypothetical protein L9G16_14830 [Shewanella sp. A25]|nr:hypothetical protein [Shewanella shenzhenensis]